MLAVVQDERGKLRARDASAAIAPWRALTRGSWMRRRSTGRSSADTNDAACADVAVCVARRCPSSIVTG